MSRIGILCAIALELNPYLADMKEKRTEEYAMHSFHSGTMAGIDVVAAFSGCGKINAAITAQTMIDTYHVDAIIFSGIAGGMTENTGIFDIVVCTASAFHDTNNEIYTDFPILPTPVFDADKYLISIARQTAVGENRKIHFGLATTGDRFTDDMHPGALCIDMETAAAAHACYCNGVPFIAIRSISDNQQEGGPEAIRRNQNEAAACAYRFVHDMLVVMKEAEGNES